jgi:AcrR family transcriptional regulator
VSHGAFYRYFESKDHIARVLTVQAMRTVSRTLVEIPDATDAGATSRAALRRWLRRYTASQASEAAMFQVWFDGALEDTSLQADSAAALDWGRRRLVRFLAPRAFGDVETEAMVMIALLSSLSAQDPSPPIIDATAHVVERGLLGR